MSATADALMGIFGFKRVEGGMKTDRELLRLAGKACGELGPDWFDNDAYFAGVLTRWNPLTDDGDALRLAVDLELIISIDSEFTRATDGMLEGVALACGDRYAATRRAIVRAAAAIGEGME